MIPKIIHFIWFGRGEYNARIKDCIDSWHRYLPDYEFKLWNEDSFDKIRVVNLYKKHMQIGSLLL